MRTNFPQKKDVHPLLIEIFEGRQGRGGRTHLVSPGMAVAAAIKGHLADVRELN